MACPKDNMDAGTGQRKKMEEAVQIASSTIRTHAELIPVWGLHMTLHSNTDCLCLSFPV